MLLALVKDWDEKKLTNFLCFLFKAQKHNDQFRFQINVESGIKLLWRDINFLYYF